jgi:glycosyltransferase involved in cell wall biosynthesis
MSPRISVIIPCYNSEKFIEDSVNSALMQDYANTEVIAIDNESTDSTFQILQRMKEDNPKLVIDTAKNIYPNCWDEGRRRAYEIMTGEYFTVIGSDDLISKQYISNYVDIIIKSGYKIKAIQSPAKGFRQEAGKTISTGLISHNYKNLNDFKAKCLEGCPVVSPTVFYSSDLINQGFVKTNPEKYGGAADYDLYCNLADKDIFIYPLPKWIGFSYRWHPEQATWKVHKEAKNYDTMIQDYWREKWKM